MDEKYIRFYSGEQYYFETVRELLELLQSGLYSIGEVTLKGQISNWKRASSGHCYFKLKDTEGAVLDVVMFRSDARDVWRELRDDLEVICWGYLDIYIPQGRLQLVARGIEKKGLGTLAQNFFRLKEKLEREGLFSPDKKRTLPSFPQKIAVIASPTGAAIRDVTETIRKRYPLCELILVPSKVQGIEAPAELSKKINSLQALKDQIDLIIIARGGGPIEDLWAFNEEPVVRAIAESKIPIITGIGHQTDQTLADLAADKNAPTPTAAAMTAVPDRRELLQEIKRREKKLKERLLAHLQHLKRELENLRDRLKIPTAHLEQARAKLEKLTLSLQHKVENKLNQIKREQKKLQLKLILSHPKEQLEKKRKRLTQLTIKLKALWQKTLLKQREKIDGQTKKLKSLQTQMLTALGERLSREQKREQLLSQRLFDLSPLRVLERGYSITFKLPEKKIIRKPDEVKSSELIEIKFANFSLVAEVKQILPTTNTKPEEKK